MTGVRTMFGKVLRDDRGTAVLETALLLPVVLMIALGFMDLTIGFQQKVQMQQYAQSGADLIIASYGAPLDDDAIKAEIVTLSGLTAADITITRWLECDNVKTADADCANTSAHKVVYAQVDVVDTYAPVLGDIGLDSFLGTVTLSGSAVVRAG